MLIHSRSTDCVISWPDALQKSIYVHLIYFICLCYLVVLFPELVMFFIIHLNPLSLITETLSFYGIH